MTFQVTTSNASIFCISTDSICIIDDSSYTRPLIQIFHLQSNHSIYGSNKESFFTCHMLLGYIFFIFNDYLIFEYNFLIFRTNFSIFSIISLIKVFILYWLAYSQGSSILISFGMTIYSKKHSIPQSEGWLLK